MAIRCLSPRLGAGVPSRPAACRIVSREDDRERRRRAGFYIAAARPACNCIGMAIPGEPEPGGDSISTTIGSAAVLTRSWRRDRVGLTLWSALWSTKTPSSVSGLSSSGVVYRCCTNNSPPTPDLQRLSLLGRGKPSPRGLSILAFRYSQSTSDPSKGVPHIENLISQRSLGVFSPATT